MKRVFILYTSALLLFANGYSISNNQVLKFSLLDLMV